ALSIIDFVKLPSQSLTNTNGVADNPTYKEYGIKSNTQSISFEHLGTFSQGQLKKTLTQYQLFSLYLSNEIQKHSALPWYKNMDINTFVSQPFYKSYLRNFNQFFNEWLHEMSYNQRSFSPYNLQADESNLFEM